MDSYSVIKPALFPDRIRTLREGKTTVPVHVQVVLSDLCNESCNFCSYRMEGGLSKELFGTEETINPNRKMPTDRAMRLMEECARLGVRAIQFTGGGEPTVHPDHLAIFDYAQSLDMRTALVTNGVRLDSLNDAIRSMAWIRVSVDAGSPHTYARTRGVSASMWSKVWANVGRLAGFRGKLGVGFVVTNENYREVAACARLCADHGVDNMRVGAVFSDRGLKYYHVDLAAIRASIEEARALGVPVDIVDLFDRRIGDLDAGRPDDPFCGYQHMTAYVGADQWLYRCCNTAYTTRGRVANLAAMTLGHALEQHGAFDARGCTHCQFMAQNRTIRAAMAVEHSEFV